MSQSPITQNKMTNSKQVIFELTDLKIIEVKGGDVLHAMKSSDSGFYGFEEAYFSLIDKNYVKAWKKHKKMTLNLIVPIGSIKFVLFNDKLSKFEIIEIGEKNYKRLTIKPNVWFGFKGIGQNKNLLLNLSNILHNPEETEILPIDSLNFNWSIN